jgi:AcrR family transcriptional regulator
MSTHTERGEKKRREVLEATLRLLAREGPRAVTHRAVAAELGTSVRATTYYFDSREALLEAALRHYGERAIARFDEIEQLFAMGLPAGPADEHAVSLAASLLGATVASDLADTVGGLVVELEWILEIARRPALEDTYAAWQARLERMLESNAARLGSPSPSLDARVALATLRGLELEALSRPSRRRTDAEIREVFARLLSALTPPAPSPLRHATSTTHAKRAKR